MAVGVGGGGDDDLGDARGGGEGDGHQRRGNERRGAAGDVDADAREGIETFADLDALAVVQVPVVAQALEGEGADVFVRLGHGVLGAGVDGAGGGGEFVGGDAQGRAGGVGGAAEAFVERPERGVAGGADLGDDRGDGLGDVRGGGGAAVEGAEGGGEAGVVVAEEAHGRGNMHQPVPASAHILVDGWPPSGRRELGLAHIQSQGWTFSASWLP